MSTKQFLGLKVHYHVFTRDLNAGWSEPWEQDEGIFSSFEAAVKTARQLLQQFRDWYEDAFRRVDFGRGYALWETTKTSRNNDEIEVTPCIQPQCLMEDLVYRQGYSLEQMHQAVAADVLRFNLVFPEFAVNFDGDKPYDQDGRDILYPSYAPDWDDYLDDGWFYDEDVAAETLRVSAPSTSDVVMTEDDWDAYFRSLGIIEHPEGEEDEDDEWFGSDPWCC